MEVNQFIPTIKISPQDIKYIEDQVRAASEMWECLAIQETIRLDQGKTRVREENNA